MKNVFDKLTRWAWLRALVLALVGVWFLLAPYSVYHVVKYVLVAWVLILAAEAFIQAWREPRGSNQGPLYRGTGLLIGALVLSVLLRPALSMLPMVVGLILVIYGITRIGTARDRQQYVNVSPFPTIIYGLVVALTGFVLLFNPFGSIMALLQVLGGVLLVMGVLELFDDLRGRRS